MHIDLYSANEDITDAAQNLLDLLKEDGLPAQTSMVTGGLICQVSGKTFPVLEQAIQHWNTQQPGRHAEPNQVMIRELEGKDTSLTITVHPPQTATTTA